MRLVKISILVLALGLGYLLFWPGPIDPEAWTPPPAPPMQGIYAPNTLLEGVERIGTGVDWGPESVAFDRAGRIYAGFEHGRIVRFEPSGEPYQAYAETGGRPLGLHFDSRGNLLVADAERGLLSVPARGEIEVLSTEAEGTPFGLTDDLDIAKDGTIYFSDATSKYSSSDYLLDVIEHGAHGRLLAYEPTSQRTQVLLDGLFCANGVAVSPDQSFVLVCETSKYRIRRYWLEGPQKGETDIFMDNLPGFPDGISSNGRDRFWVALVSPRVPWFDTLLPYPRLRKALLRLGIPDTDDKERISPRYGFVLGLDTNGRVVRNLQDPTGTFYDTISSVEEHTGKLYMGSYAQDAIGRLSIP
jgi:sugar lactone lactonase YvrE